MKINYDAGTIGLIAVAVVLSLTEILLFIDGLVGAVPDSSLMDVVRLLLPIFIAIATGKLVVTEAKANNGNGG